MLRADRGSLAPIANTILVLVGLVGLTTALWLTAQIREADYALRQTRAHSALTEYAQAVVQEANVAGISAARALGPATYPATQEKVTLGKITVASNGGLLISESAANTNGQVTNVTATISAPLAGIGAYVGNDSDGQAEYAATSASVPAVAIWTLSEASN